LGKRRAVEQKAIEQKAESKKQKAIEAIYLSEYNHLTLR
jgi:hypothetical protein